MRLPVILEIRASPMLATALFLAHGLVALETASAGLPGMLAASVLSLILLSLGFSIWRYVYRPPVQALRLKADGTLEVDCRGAGCAARLDPRTTVFPWLVVLLLEIGNRKVSLALPPDALGRDGHRRLRLWLGWKASAATA